MVDIEDFVAELPLQFLLAAATVISGLVIGYIVSVLTRQLLRTFGVDESVEGTAFERTAQGLGTSTVGLLAQLVALIMYVVAALLALHIIGVVRTTLIWAQAVGFLPNLFVATLAIILGLVVGDKVSLHISEQLKSVKLPETGILPATARYSIIFVAILIALSQVGVAISALLLLLAVYAFALVLFGGLAFKDLLAAGAAGIYLLLTQPYGIGDEVRIDDNQGIVQEVDMFTTHIEREGEEYIVPNHLVMRSSIVRIRD